MTDDIYKQHGYDNASHFRATVQGYRHEAQTHASLLAQASYDGTYWINFINHMERMVTQLQERNTALEGALREMVYPQDYPDAYWDFDSEWEQYSCGYCLGMSDVMIRKPGKSAGIKHDPDCPVVKARALLEDK